MRLLLKYKAMSSGKGERDWELVFVLVHPRSDALAVHAPGVDGKACFLEGLQGTVDGAGVAVFISHEIGHGLAILGGHKRLYYSPLKGQLVTAGHGCPCLKEKDPFSPSARVRDQLRLGLKDPKNGPHRVRRMSTCYKKNVYSARIIPLHLNTTYFQILI